MLRLCLTVVCLVILIGYLWVRLTGASEDWLRYPPGDLDRPPFPSLEHIRR